MFLSLCVGGYLLFLIARDSDCLSFRSLFENWIVQFIGFFVGLSLFVGVLLGLNIFFQGLRGNSIGQAFVWGGFLLFVCWFCSVLTHSSSRGSGSYSNYRNSGGGSGVGNDGSGGSDGGGGGDGDGGDGGCGGCGGCGD